MEGIKTSGKTSICDIAIRLASGLSITTQVPEHTWKWGLSGGMPVSLVSRWMDYEAVGVPGIGGTGLLGAEGGVGFLGIHIRI